MDWLCHRFWVTLFFFFFFLQGASREVSVGLPESHVVPAQAQEHSPLKFSFLGGNRDGSGGGGGGS